MSPHVHFCGTGGPITEKAVKSQFGLNCDTDAYGIAKKRLLLYGPRLPGFSN
jgi:hypothetical protein